VFEAQKALELGDREGVLAAVRGLEELRPRDPLPPYLRARVAEHDGFWNMAALHYRKIFVSPDIDPSPEWSRLAAGRWVRVRRYLGEARVRAMMAAPDSQARQPGLCLVLPFEPMLLGEGAAAPDLNLEALGVAAASWVVGALAQAPGVEPVELSTAFLLREFAGSRGAHRGRLVALAPEEETAPPITTTWGVAYRLEHLVPNGPAPWAPQEDPPAYYLEDAPPGAWSPEAARALAHFQSEHDLAPSGNLDPQTRRRLEQAYRQHRGVLTATPAPAWSDPIQAMGHLVGADGVLTGTLESRQPGSVHWNVAWISSRDGRLLSRPLDGILPAAHFGDAWARMIRRIVAAAPGYAPPGDGAEIAVPEIPNLEGLQDYGNALLLVEDLRGAEAALLFKRAAARGAGERALWYAMAWSHGPEELGQLEEELMSEAIYGRPRFNAVLLERESLPLAGGAVRHIPPGASSVATLPQSVPLTHAPRTSWIHVSGRVE
jgi:hypothetical protein